MGLKINIFAHFTDVLGNVLKFYYHWQVIELYVIDIIDIFFKTVRNPKYLQTFL